jgi:hypothetical protein
MSPEQMTLDPIFQPAADASPVSNIVDVGDHVDPLIFFGCSTRTAIPESDVLPDGLTRFDDLHLTIAHPSDWQVSNFEMNDFDVTALAPQPVTADTVAAYVQGETAPPMLLFYVLREEHGVDINPFMLTLLADIDQTFEGNDPVYDALPDDLVQQEYARVNLREFYDEYETIHYGLFTTRDDWEANQPMYESMLRYIDGMQFYERDDMQHTLFLRNFFMGNSYNAYIAIPYPQGWVEQTDEVGYVIAPEGVPLMDAPLVRVVPLRLFEEQIRDDFYVDRVFIEALRWIGDHYGIPNVESYIELADDGYEVVTFEMATTTLTFNFEQEGKYGEIQLTPDGIIAVEYVSDTDENNDVLNIMYEAAQNSRVPQQ